MAIEHTIDSALARAVIAAGSQSAFGRLIGRRQSTISLWLTRGTPLPAEYVETVERETGIAKAELRPDLPWETANALPALPAITTVDPAR